MAHYAFLNENNIVTEVIVGIDENELIEGVEPEIWYANFKNQTCKRTSYNANVRGKYAGIGDSYDEVNDIFVSPKPYPSWIQNGSHWSAPIEMPIDGKHYQWDETEGKWNELS
jgi:hypothetical protein